MKTIDRYILRQLIAVTFLGVLSLTLLMLLGQLFKELHSLLVESGAPPSIVIDFILQVIPFSLTFSVPWCKNQKSSFCNNKLLSELHMLHKTKPNQLHMYPSFSSGALLLVQ